MDRIRTGIPKGKWISDKLWAKIVGSIPLACVDIVFQREDRSILLGWRLIEPYRGVWALPGGRILYRDDLLLSARRIARRYGLRFRRLYLVGVFPINFPIRSDVSIALAALDISGGPKPDGYEFSEFAWVKDLPPNCGANYRRMVIKWRLASRSKDFLRVSRVL